MFKQRNESFVCINCNKKVKSHPSSCRDHCNHCLFGLHVDNDPGDRLNPRRGVLEPVGLRKKGGKEQIVFKCQKCHDTAYCIVSLDDNFNAILELTLVEY